MNRAAVQSPRGTARPSWDDPASRPAGGRDPAARISRRALLQLTGAAAAVWLGSCRIAQPAAVTLPSRHSVAAEQLLVQSDFKLGADHAVIQDLNRLRASICSILQLPPERERVVVYVFSNELSYRQYLQATFPQLPPRRAYFVGTPQGLAVYTFWGERLQEDLRHEYTHGLLHSCHPEVPLWLDEGLAEYFEVPEGRPGHLNSDYAERLANALSNGWRPDLKRLESLKEFSQMQRTDYQEAWAWVHFLLHHSADSRRVLLDYLHDLRASHAAEPVSERLAREIPSYHDRLVSHVGSLAQLADPQRFAARDAQNDR